ncbi:MAG: DUF1080 domain-containing protein [bacterium]|nr:DUF1080 domain-containing protein [bacterium]
MNRPFYATISTLTLIASLIAAPGAFAQFQAPDGYQRIFNGNSLDGWTMQWPGDWQTQRGTLVGRQDKATGGDSWMFTDQEYDDFSLELEFNVSEGGNSGVGIRMPQGQEGRPSQYGFEIQICDSDEQFPTGSVFRHVAAKPGLHQAGKWNTMAIIAVKDHIVVYINRAKALDAHVEGSMKGCVGLQVHGTEKYKDQVVQFRNIRIKDLKPQYAAEPSPVQFKAHQIDNHNGEGLTVVDVNNDGKLDITSGPNWYEGPNWTKHPYREVTADAEFMQDFGEVPMDVNRDGKVDVITGGWFEPYLYWYENSGKPEGMWKRHVISNDIPSTETILQQDLDRDGRPDVLMDRYDGSIPVRYYAYVGLDKSDTGFEMRELGPQGGGHGMGVGDMNRDGRIDVFTPSGWYECPIDPRTQPWEFHSKYRIEHISAPMALVDLNNDGLMDIVYGQGHEFGLFWIEQTIDSAGREAWIYHDIDPTFSQIHIILMEDIDRDGTDDIVCGKRYRGHAGADPGANEPLCIFWYKVEKGPSPKFTKHIITYDENIGIGMDMEFVDIDHDGDRDLITAGKSGQYILENLSN